MLENSPNNRPEMNRRTHQLDCNLDDGLDGEVPLAQVEQVLEAWPQQLHHQRVELRARAEVEDLRKALCYWVRCGRTAVAEVGGGSEVRGQ